MRIAFVTRSTLNEVPGGDTVQIHETAKHLRNTGIAVHLFSSNEKIPYQDFDLLHFFNLIRPADILYHIKKTNKPSVISPILVDYSEYDKNHRKGLSGLLLKSFLSGEYLKTVSRWVLGKDSLQSKEYLWKGQQRSVREILHRTAMVLPNSHEEYAELKKRYLTDRPYKLVPNGIDEELFHHDNKEPREENLVVCAARIEGIKNQMNLIKALNNTQFTLILAGASSQNQTAYYKKCRQLAASNIVFAGRLTQKELVNYYSKAKVHVLPSWFETCGLSSLEAAAMGCSVVITDKGFARAYFGNHAFYCDPGNTTSIYEAVSQAAKNNASTKLQQIIKENYTWKQAAGKTLQAYKTILSSDNIY